jgi:hypothetical protein
MTMTDHNNNVCIFRTLSRVSFPYYTFFQIELAFFYSQSQNNNNGTQNDESPTKENDDCNK